MIPDFVIVDNSPWGLLPEGIHLATMQEVQERFAFNERRKKLFEGFYKGAEHLFQIGCPNLLLDGSYVTEKPEPEDYDVLWNTKGVTNISIIDPVMLDFTTDQLREAQKQKYGGEFIPNASPMKNSKDTFLNLFQTDKHTGAKKGIIRVNNWLKT